jgi:hypothetical protein
MWAGSLLRNCCLAQHVLTRFAQEAASVVLVARLDFKKKAAGGIGDCDLVLI